MESLRQQALESNASPLALRQQLLATIKPDVEALLPSAQNMARFIQRCRQKAGQSNVKAGQNDVKAGESDVKASQTDVKASQTEVKAGQTDVNAVQLD